MAQQPREVASKPFFSCSNLSSREKVATCIAAVALLLIAIASCGSAGVESPAGMFGDLGQGLGLEGIIPLFIVGALLLSLSYCQFQVAKREGPPPVKKQNITAEMFDCNMKAKELFDLSQRLVSQHGNLCASITFSFTAKGGDGATTFKRKNDSIRKNIEEMTPQVIQSIANSISRMLPAYIVQCTIVLKDKENQPITSHAEVVCRTVPPQNE